MLFLLFCFFFFFFFNDTATTEIYTLSLHDALPIYLGAQRPLVVEAQRDVELARLQRELELLEVGADRVVFRRVDARVVGGRGRDAGDHREHGEGDGAERSHRSSWGGAALAPPPPPPPTPPRPAQGRPRRRPRPPRAPPA